MPKDCGHDVCKHLYLMEMCKVGVQWQFSPELARNMELS